MRGIELRQLRYFSILAKELHFRKAAELAFVTQPALSQQIAKLEETVGVMLLKRDRHTVELTPAGIALRDELRKIFAQLDEALRMARATATDREFRIAIGLVEYTNLPFVPPALIRLQAVYPALSVERHEMNSLLQMEALQNRRIDVGFGVQIAPLPENCSIRTQPLLTSPWALLMRADHRLAALDRLRVEDLAGERLIIFERDVNPVLYDGVLAVCRAHGFKPGFVYETRQGQVGVSLVSQGLGLMLGAAYVFSALPGGLVLRSIGDMAPLTVQLFARSDERDPLILELMDLAAEEARRTQLLLNAPGPDTPA